MLMLITSALFWTGKS